MINILKLPELDAACTDMQQSVRALASENVALHETVAALQQQLAALEQGRVADPGELQQLQWLREANQHLVLATFGAQDSTSAAEAVNRRQTIFLSMLAHELRNPMASIAIANSVMEGLHLVHPSAAKLLAIVGRQVTHLIRLTDDLLDASRISTGKISLQTQMILLRDVIDTAIEAAQPSYAKRDQTLHIHMPAASIALYGDIVRLAQLFTNLLTNASKFSDVAAVVDITVRVQGDHVRVAVRDHGRGIALKYQSGIFDLFAQGEDALEHALSGGLGIGLSLVKTIAEMHGGSVSVESGGVGCGSEFIVLLPLPATASGPVQSATDDT